MSNIPLILRTLVHLRPQQVCYQVRKRILRPRYALVHAPATTRCGLTVPCILKPNCWDGEEFNFLNLKSKFTNWDDAERGNLWCYNLNYMDWLGQEGITEKEGTYWIDKFIADIPTIGMGLDPYPIALRSINWIKFFFKYPEVATSQREDALFSQLKLLEKKLEYHLLGNHLLEDGYALYIGGVYFNDKVMLQRAEKLVTAQLKEQVLSDGMHYEQSPMYHCILLDRLLDCINFRSTDFLRDTATKMLGFLECIIWKDKTIPLFNDAAYGIAPTPEEIFDYANRLSIQWRKGVLKASGYRKMVNEEMEAVIDVGNMTATYQPGHSQADTFSYELRINGRPFIIDTGISTYNKTPRRQYERSTEAHNTVVVNGHNSSEVWGGFRVGRRAKVRLLEDKPEKIIANHYGYSPVIHTREFAVGGSTFEIKDTVSKQVKAVSLIHLAPNVTVVSADNNMVKTDVGNIKIINADSVEIINAEVSTEYNVFKETSVVKIHFNSSIKYSIEI